MKNLGADAAFSHCTRLLTGMMDTNAGGGSSSRSTPSDDEILDLTDPVEDEILDLTETVKEEILELTRPIEAETIHTLEASTPSDAIGLEMDEEAGTPAGIDSFIDDDAPGDKVVELNDITRLNMDADFLPASQYDETGTSEPGGLDAFEGDLAETLGMFIDDHLPNNLRAEVGDVSEPSGAMLVTITPEQIDEALERVIRKMYGEKIEAILLDVIDQTVSSEIIRLKDVLLNAAGEDTQADT